MGLTRTSAFRYHHHGKSDTGVVRDENQDSFCIHAPEDPEELSEKGILLVIADGMGGLAFGATASQIAVEAMREVYLETDAPPREALLAAAKETNTRIFLEAQKLPGNQPMGSTLTAMVILDGRGLIAQVGDSRAYGIPESQELTQLTRDHTLVQELADRGEIEQDSLPYILHRNVLTRGLGLQEDVEIDLFEIDAIEAGDQFLLCSDGLYDVVTEAEIESRMKAQGEAQSDLLDYFVELAKSRGAPDNVTVVVARVEPDDGEGPGAAGDVASDQGRRSGRALGFVPATILAPVSYFLVFALGVGTALHFEESPASPVPEPATALPTTAVEVLEHPLGAEFLRAKEADGSDATTLRVDVDEFLRWLEERK